MFNYIFDGNGRKNYSEIIKHPREIFLFEKTLERIKNYFEELECDEHKKQLTVVFSFREFSGFCFYKFETCCDNLKKELVIPTKGIWVKPFIDRTQLKLDYAKNHLKLIIDFENTSKDSRNRDALSESFLFQLISGLDALYQELNIYYGLNLTLTDVGFNKIKKALEKNRIISPEIEEIDKLLGENESWLSEAKYFRNEMTHKLGTPRVINVYVGDPAKDTIQFKNSKTGTTQNLDTLKFFNVCLINMETLINSLRESSIWNNIKKKRPI